MTRLMMPARSVASLLAHVFGPSWYDGPHYGWGTRGALASEPDPIPWRSAGLAAGPQPEPWRAYAGLASGPRPEPWRTAHAIALADAHIHQLLALDRTGSLLGGEAMERAEGRALRLIAEIDELCPRWPKWPPHWPPPPQPWDDREMKPTELLVFGARLLAASELLEQSRIQNALATLGEKAMGLSLGADRQTAK